MFVCIPTFKISCILINFVSHTFLILFIVKLNPNNVLFLKTLINDIKIGVTKY